MKSLNFTSVFKYYRPFLFFIVFLLHALLIYSLNFKDEPVVTDTEEFVDAQVFKLVDVIEQLPPLPVEEKTYVEVTNQPAASEKIIETEEEVRIVQEEIDYLPQHKISSVPVIPSREVLSRIVYPPLALKQGIEGIVYLELYIDGEGVIRKINVLKDPGHGFAQSAVAALTGLTCIPANANGKNCAVRYRYPVKFTLN
ncbi:TonB family protein [Treponema rectale]|uniref:Protein TonB n=1 Tax=Treponema rectale TaxID=744512 RepID=A0A840SEJ4_9SPIR|nr:TonB family protein [Treponema rectale]MBB5217861.1 protein TonB [Treponema rectale]QOS40415.1 TonB family protein [Treponema rectale]